MPILQQAASKNLGGSLLRTSKHAQATRHLFTRSAPVKRNPIRTGLYTTAFVLSAGVFAVYYFDARSAMHRYVLTPVLRNVLDAETGHKVAVKALKAGIAPKDPVEDDARLTCKVIMFHHAHLSPLTLCNSCGVKKSPTQSVWLQVLTRTEKLSMVRPLFTFQVYLHLLIYCNRTIRSWI